MPDFGPTAPLTPPLYPTAVYVFPDLDAVDAVYTQQQPGFIYARDGHPNAARLADQLTRLEAAAWGVVCGSGMAAVSAAVLPLVAAGDRLVVSDKLYGKTTKLLRQELKRFGVTCTAVDACDLDAVTAACQAGPVRAVFVETLSNPMCRLPDLPALAEISRAAGAKLIVDNTFATPVLCKPLALGADLVVESLTKLIGGHSDLTLGYVGGTDPDHGPAVAAAVSTWGLAAPPFDCWLAERGLSTLALRTDTAAANARALADWLAEQPAVRRVVYPGRPDHPDHALAKRLVPGFGTMLCFELADREAVNRFLRAAPGVPFSPSLGHVTSTVSHPDTTSHRSDSPADKARQGITPGLVRLSVGCESFRLVRDELSRGFGS
jgi:cystathionine beta-lyase/cystathionine gamma-synthase